MVKIPLIAASSLLAAVALGTPAHADPRTLPPSYGSNGTFAVGTEPRDGLTAFIPPGRFRVDQSPSMNPYLSAPGYWQRCHNVLCAPSYPGHIIATGFAQRDRSTFMEILPSDTAVYLYNVTLTVAG